MLNKDKNSRKKKSLKQEEIVKRTKKGVNPRNSHSPSSSNKPNGSESKVVKRKVKEAPQRKKASKKPKKPKKQLTAKQIRGRNIIIGILTIIIIGGLCALAVIEFKKQDAAKSNIVKQQQQTIDGFTDEQLITAANAYIGNVEYNFKSVYSKSKASNGDLVATLIAMKQVNGKYNTTKVNVTYEVANGAPLVINEKSTGQTESNTSSAIEGAGQVQNKLDVTYKVVDYLEGTGMSVNDTNWAMDIFENRTVDGQTGYLIDVYKIQGSVSNSIEWIFVTNNGQMYNAGQTGAGPLSPLS